MNSQKAKFTIGCFGIVLDEQKNILLAHRTDMDIWNLPGGGMEYGEGPRETVVREVKEETGLDVAVEKLIGIYKKEKNKSDIVFMFLCNKLSGELTLSNESDQLKYFGINQFPLHTNPKHVSRIKDFFDAPKIFHMKCNNEIGGKELLENRDKQKLDNI